MISRYWFVCWKGNIGDNSVLSALVNKIFDIQLQKYDTILLRIIGSFLKELRKEKGLTQEQTAEKLNVSGRTISRWETGGSLS